MASVTHLTNQSQFVQSNAVFNGTNISGTIASNGLSLSVAPGGGGADGYNILAAGSQTANTTGTILFNNANGITFGMSNSSVITASHNGLTTAMASNRGTDFVQATAAFAGTNATGTIASNGISVSVAPQTAFVFSNSNGVSFGTNGSTVTATVATNYQSQGAYLTTAMASNRGSDFMGTNTALTANGVSMTANSSGLSLNFPAFLTTAQPVGAYLTTARASNDAVGLNTALTAGPLAWTVNSSGISLNAGSGAGTTSGFGGNLISGSMTHNTAGLNLSLNHPAWLTTAMQSNAATISNIRVSAGTTSNLLSAITFSNSNGMSFGLNGSVMTGSHNGLTTARASNDAVGLNTAGTNVTWTVNSSGISINASGYAGTGSTFNGTNVSGSMTMNSNGLRLDLSAGAGGGITPVASASNGSFSFTTLGFSNANNVTFGTSAGGIITASVAAPGAAAENNWVNLLGANTAGNTTASGSTIGYSGINLTLSGTNGSVINISAPAVSSIVGSSGISISTDGSSITIGKRLQSTYVPFGPYSTNSQTLAALGATSGSARFFPIFISDNIVFNALRVMHNLSYATSSVSGQQTISYQYGLFSNNNSGLLLSISSGSFSLAVTNSSISNTVSYPVSTGTGGYTYTTLGASSTATIQSFWGTAAGGRPLDLQFGNTMSLSSGMYWLGVNLRHSSSSANIGVSIALGGNANALWNSLAPWGVASSAQTTNSAYRVPYAGLGAYTVSQSSLPNSVPLTGIAHTQTIMPLVSFLST